MAGLFYMETYLPVSYTHLDVYKRQIMSIRINDLTVRFKNGVVAVNKASLEIPKGIYGLLGENCLLYTSRCV